MLQRLLTGSREVSKSVVDNKGRRTHPFCQVVLLHSQHIRYSYFGLRTDNFPAPTLLVCLYHVLDLLP